MQAYRKTRATAVQIARIAAFTVIACTTILGLCMIASSWVEATASCSQLIHAEALLHQQQQVRVLFFFINRAMMLMNLHLMLTQINNPDSLISFKIKT